MSNRFKAVGLFCWVIWGGFALPCRPVLQFFSENFNFFCCFQNVFNFPAANFLLAAGIFFAFCSSFQFIFMFSILYLLNKEDFHYEHHDRHRPRLLRYQNSALFISGWTYQLRRTRTLHPPRTLRVWRVLFCLWLWAAAYPEGQNCERQLLPADTGSHCKKKSSSAVCRPNVLCGLRLGCR